MLSRCDVVGRKTYQALLDPTRSDGVSPGSVLAVPAVSSTVKGGALGSGAAFARSSLAGGAVAGRLGGANRWTPSGAV